MSAACTAALTTFELLENILVHRPPHSLGAAVLVCKTWKTLVNQSIRLPDLKVATPNWHDSDTNLPRARNPYSQITSIALHPAFDEDEGSSGVVHGEQSPPYIIRQYCICFNSVDDLTAFKHAGPKDFATMPPVGCMLFHRSVGAWTNTLRVKGGIRIEHVAARVKEHVKKGTRTVIGECFVVSPYERSEDESEDTDGDGGEHGDEDDSEDGNEDGEEGGEEDDGDEEEADDGGGE